MPEKEHDPAVPAAHETAERLAVTAGADAASWVVPEYVPAAVAIAAGAGSLGCSSAGWLRPVPTTESGLQ